MLRLGPIEDVGPSYLAYPIYKLKQNEYGSISKAVGYGPLSPEGGSGRLNQTALGQNNLRLLGRSWTVSCGAFVGLFLLV